MVDSELKKKKLLILTSGFPRWKEEGLNQFMYEYANSLSTYYEVVVLAPKDSESTYMENWNRVKVYRHPQSPFSLLNIAYGSGIMPNIKRKPWLIFGIPFFILFQLIYLIRIIKKEHPELINAHWIIPQGLCLRIVNLFKKDNFKSICTAHGSDYWSMNTGIFKLLRNWSITNQDLLVTVSEAMLIDLNKKNKVGNAIYVPIGVNTDTFKILPRGSNDHSSQFNILFVGNLVKEKGVVELVEAFNFVHEHNKNVTLTFIGEGGMKEYLMNYCLRNGLESHVKFLGIIPNHQLPIYLNKANVFCLPSYSEGFPISLKEALSCGINSIVTELPIYFNDSELRKILHFVKSKNSKEIGNKIIDLYENDEKLIRREDLRNYILKNASWDIISSNLKSAFEKL